MIYNNTKILFPLGKNKALTLSYDDGVTQDKRLIEILDRYGIKGTFNLNSGAFGQKDELMVRGVKVNHSHIPAEEIKETYRNHEVAVHTLTHPWLEKLPKEIIMYEVMEDKKNLEELVEYPVRGMAYPFGTYDERVIEVLKEVGIEYSRNVKAHSAFRLPERYHEWDSTCHHGTPDLLKLAQKFIDEDNGQLQLFYLWGHSYEFDADGNWETIEEFCKITGRHSEVWYATNIEIVDYMNAAKSLKFSCTGSSIYNPTGTDVWLSINGRTVEIKSGSTVAIK